MQEPVRISRNRAQAMRGMPFKRRRFWLICLFFALWAVVIAGRLFMLQIVRHKEFVERADRQQERTFEVAPRRGVIYDRNLHELAMTVLVNSIYAVPTSIENKQATARILASVVHTDPEDRQTTAKEIARRLEIGHSFAWVARRVTPKVAKAVRKLIAEKKVKGIYFQKEFKRFYPNNVLAAQMLGYVGIDDVGLGGLELKYESRLHGAPGRMYTAVDARAKVLGSTERAPQPGQNLVMTIDEKIQFMAEQALDHAMQRTHAADGTIVIQDVHTGQILALAIRPTYNPNDFRHTNPKLLRDRAVSDVYEPGSVFKLVTYSAALNEHLTAPDDLINCQGGAIKLAGRIIHDDQSDHYWVIPVYKALEVSSDVAAVKLALKLGPQRFYRYIRSYGFGSRTGVELPAETRGLLQPPSKWSGSSIGSIAMGQEIGVTPIQLVTMVSTIANGGIYLPPHVLMPGQVGESAHARKDSTPLKASPFRPDEQLPNPLPPGAHRVISEHTAAIMRKLMQDVVLHGTGKNAQLNGYTSGGKTGTAQKINPATHRYSKTMHIASFAGIAPVNNPVIAVVVVIDDPKGAYYGATVAAPVFAEVAQEVLEYLGVPHDMAVHSTLNNAKNEKPIVEDTSEPTGDIQALYDAANDLPADDPLHDADNLIPAAGSNNAQNRAENETASGKAYASSQAVKARPPGTAVMINEREKLKVPSLVGLSMREVVETAAAAGFKVQVKGNGIAREQAPAPGTMVVSGTRIAVQCSR